MSIITDFSILENLTKENYILQILEQRLPEFYLDFKKIVSIKIQPYKKHFGKTSATFVAAYLCKYQDQQAKTRDLSIFVSAHTDGSRQASFNNNIFLYAQGFSTGQYIVPKPLFYLAKLDAFFYEGVRGRILKKLIKDEPQRDLRPVLNLASGWLRNLHNIDCTGKNFRPKDFQINAMRPQPVKFIGDFVSEHLELGKKLATLFQEVLDLEAAWQVKINKTLVHGDYHLENIVVSGLEPDRVKVIDFTDLAWGDPCLDLGGFLQQFDFMLQNTLLREQINNYKKYFIESYFNADFAEIDADFFSRINLYQAWTTLRTVALLFYTKNAHHQLDNVLTETERYLDLSRQQSKQVNLN